MILIFILWMMISISILFNNPNKFIDMQPEGRIIATIVVLLLGPFIQLGSMLETTLNCIVEATKTEEARRREEDENNSDDPD